MSLEEVVGEVALAFISAGASAYFAGKKARQDVERSMSERLSVVEAEAKTATALSQKMEAILMQNARLEEKIMASNKNVEAIVSVQGEMLKTLGKHDSDIAVLASEQRRNK